MRDKGRMKRKGKNGKKKSCKTRYQRINQNWEINRRSRRKKLDQGFQTKLIDNQEMIFLNRKRMR
jgi:hypothetical protein